ncbi:protein-methionine-sulfoxide reductase heme-binding subunit MsrQ [Rhizobium sp. KVB221]|uniref:Protein-methionine-sulfoxide reductase heme-binding subunit MsrQ n=1 Tax=Rhizobium setariae TaxID=2801340 RepID=A0A936YPT4_9HYPH|nr:protein-methionine-sulfoxide reductase heme-binding subunit MsrQ [Rhizobium setariae]
MLAKISPWWIYGIGFIPAAWYFYHGAINDLGANPIQTFEHLLGEWALRFMIATLLVTPLRDLTRVNFIRFRRALGLMTFYYVLMHFLTYFILDRGMNLPVIFVDILKRPYIILGMTAFVGLIALAATSNTWSIRTLGRGWGRLHKLVYLIATLGVVHFFMAVKSWPPRPFVYATIIGVLLGYRLVKLLLDQRRAAA